MQGADPARLLSAGMGAGGDTGMMTPAAGSALSLRRHPSAGAQGAPSPSPTSQLCASSLLWVRGLSWLPGRQSTLGKDAAEGGEAPAQELTGRSCWQAAV